jgi:hypothetical protein
MKQTFVLTMLLLILMAGLPGLKAQSLVIRLNNGTENPELLSTIRNLTFSASDMMVAFKTGSTDVYGLSDIQKLYFDTGTASATNILADDSKLSIYPNPADNRIVIRNIPKETTMINIYRSDGSLILQQAVTSDQETIHVSNLQSGLYLIIANGRSAKFIRL